MMIKFSLVFLLLGITQTQATSDSNLIDKVKMLLQKYIPVSLLNLYRTYTYNLSLGESKTPFNVLQRLISTTKKLFNNRKKILFYPDYPYRKATIYQLCLLLGYEVTDNPKEKFDLAIKWQRYETFFTEEPTLSRFAKEKIDVLNLNCQDVSKSLINRVFEEAFGYSIAVDPLTYTGKCVVKSNLNAQHDGKIVSCPVEKIEASGVVYQKLIENDLEGDRVIDYRVPIFKKHIPFVYIYIKHNKTETQRFFGYPSLISVQVLETKEILNQPEINNILDFCQKLGLDYGELDVLRDKTDQRIYIVDANNTPSSRLLFEPLQLAKDKCILSASDRKKVLEKMAEAFQQEFLNIEK
ncbi:MAG: hypothetical protein QNJ18_07770 [Xenococcaceae cyanobacterium MO_167.B52]|nr:hypothetical protein [Xenococcaceae cyanobacterium MO_167.B52]